jgi:hypothetical protein
MKVLDLRCANGHRFEGWFGSDEDFMEQNGSGLVECPLCADKLVTRMPSAPRLNLSSSTAEPVPARPADLQAAWMKAVRQVIANTENVGERFAEEARRIHYGEAEQRGIRGQASREDRQALEDEGIEVHPLPLPAALKDPLQ